MSSLPFRRSNANSPMTKMSVEKGWVDATPSAPPTYLTPQLPAWINKMGASMSHVEFSEFFVETIIKNNNHLEAVVRPNDEIGVNVIEGVFNTYYPQTIDTQLGNLQCHLAYNASKLCCLPSARREFDIFLLWASQYSTDHLKHYKHWLEALRKSAPNTPIIMVRCYTDEKGAWQPGIDPKQDKGVFDGIVNLPTIQLDESPSRTLDSNNTLCQVLTRCALLQLMNQRKGSDHSRVENIADISVPTFKYIKRTYAWEE